MREPLYESKILNQKWTTLTDLKEGMDHAAEVIDL